MQNLDDLIARVAAAKGQDRDLDIDIFLRLISDGEAGLACIKLGYVTSAKWTSNGEYDLRGPNGEHRGWWGAHVIGGSVTGSFDAAMAFRERHVPDWPYQKHEHFSDGWEVTLAADSEESRDDPHAFSQAATLALGILGATLLALKLKASAAEFEKAYPHG